MTVNEFTKWVEHNANIVAYNTTYANKIKLLFGFDGNTIHIVQLINVNNIRNDIDIINDVIIQTKFIAVAITTFGLYNNVDSIITIVKHNNGKLLITDNVNNGLCNHVVTNNFNCSFIDLTNIFCNESN